MVEICIEQETSVPETRPEVKLKTESSAIVQKANSVTIASESDRQFASAFTCEIQSLKKRVKNHHADSKKKTHEAWKAVCAMEDAMLEPLDKAFNVVNSKILAYDSEMRRIQEEKQRRNAEEAEKLRKQAEKAIKKGDEERAEDLQVQAAMKVAEVTYVPQKTEGVSTRYSWTWEIGDITQVPREYLTVDADLLNSIVKTQKATSTDKPEDFVRKIPGIKFSVKSTLVVRAKAQ